MNLYKFNWTSTEETKKDISKIAHIIKAERFDIIALQEILSIDAFRTLREKMGENEWDGICAPSSSYFTHGSEYYGFLWRKSRFDIIGTPLIYRWYKSKDSMCKNGLLRPPYYARYTSRDKIGGSFFEFRIINTHILFNKPEKALDLEGDIELRREELRLLSERIFTSVSDKRYGDNMPAYTFLIGDYNLCLFGLGPKIDFEYDLGKERFIVHDQTDLTSLKQVNEDGEYFGDYYSNNYDHVSYEKSTKEKLRITASRVDALKKYCGDDLEKYRHDVSDHVPIKVTISFK